MIQYDTESITITHNTSYVFIFIPKNTRTPQRYGATAPRLVLLLGLAGPQRRPLLRLATAGRLKGAQELLPPGGNGHREGHRWHQGDTVKGTRLGGTCPDFRRAFLHRTYERFFAETLEWWSMMDLFDSGELTWSSRRDPLKDTLSFLSFPQFTEIQKLRKKKMGWCCQTFKHPGNVSIFLGSILYMYTQGIQTRCIHSF